MKREREAQWPETIPVLIAGRWNKRGIAGPHSPAGMCERHVESNRKGHEFLNSWSPYLLKWKVVSFLAERMLLL